MQPDLKVIQLSTDVSVTPNASYAFMSVTWFLKQEFKLTSIFWLNQC